MTFRLLYTVGWLTSPELKIPKIQVFNPKKLYSFVFFVCLNGIFFFAQHDNFQNGLSLWLLRVGRASAAQFRRIFSSRIHFWMFQKRWIISGIDSGESRPPTYSKTFSKSSCKSMKINRKSMKFNENHWNSTKINENQWKLTYFSIM